ncbi:MAG: winged helix-turn-helix domain-containing protein [Burkholderiaceae bacterium]
MQSYHFGAFVLDAAGKRLLRDTGDLVVMSPRLFDALHYFVERPDQLLDKDMLLAAWWPGLVVEENSLSQTISALRRTLADDAQNSRYIQTVPRRGFRFIARVTPSDSPVAEIRSEPTMEAAVQQPMIVEPSKPRRRLLALGVAAGASLVAAGGAAWWWREEHAARMPSTSVSLAVLPFRPLILEARDEMLEIGMADSLVARLSTLPGVAVRSIGSTRLYAGPTQDPIKAARELQVQWIVDGSIQRWGDQVRVSARLLNADTGEAAWSGAFDERFTGMFDVQDAISKRVADVLAPRLAVRDRMGLADIGGTRNIDAYQLYLAARQQAQGIRTAGLVRSIALFGKAIALDPTYALAHAGIAESERRMIFGSDGEPRVVFAEAEQSAARSIELEPSLAAGFASVGWNLYWHAWDWQRAETTFRHAIALNPNEVNAHFGLGQLLGTLKRYDEQLSEMRIARELDPLSLVLLTLESGSLFFTGKRDEAWQRLQRVFDIEPDFWIAHLAAGQFHRAEKRNDLAIDSMERADRFADGSSQPATALGYVLARTGQVERARAMADGLRDASTRRYVPPTSYGLIYAALDDKEAALSALEKAFALRDVRMTLMNDDVRWSSLKDQPRYLAVIGRMKFPA